MTQPTFAQRLQGLAATLAILLFVVGLPFVLVAIGVAPWDADLGRLDPLLTSPDDGTLAMVVIAVVAWIAWLVLAITVVVEAVARFRGLPTPSLPGFGAPQRAVGELVTAAALLFIATPSLMAVFPTPPAHAAAAAPLLETPRLAAVETAPLLHDAAPILTTAETPTKQKSTIDYTVKRGDSLWKIADHLLGDGARFPEIVELNNAVLNGRPDFIVSGTVLKVPYETPEPVLDHPAEEYVVKAGDTLSEIAEAKLGDPMRYPALFQASRDTVQPDGATLTDPNLIRPGWEITIPGPAKHKTGEPEKPPVAVTPPVSVDPPVETPTPEPTPPPRSTAATDDPDPRPAVSTPDATDDEGGASTLGWLVPGLTGGGAVLAGLVLLAVRAQRNTQLRYRRPGQTLAPPPPELRAVEKTAFVSGAPMTSTVEQLDRGLRLLAGLCKDAGRTLPTLVTVALARGAATLHLAASADLPEPWRGGDREWSLRLDEPLEDRQDVIAPYPLLVTVGQDETGGLHLVNLEHLGTVSLTGDPTTSTALARHIAAELTLNPWSVLVDVAVIGLGEELATLDTLRLRHYADGSQVIDPIVRSLASARESGWGDPEPYRVIITTGDGAHELAGFISPPGPRLGAAVVSLASPVPESTVIEVDHSGRLHAPLLGLDLLAAGLTSDEAAACAAIVDLTRESEAVKVAPFERAADGWRALADQAGALLEELTDARDDGPAGDSSLLPKTAEEYADVAATTATDIERLAPAVTEQVRRTVEEADPLLDEDVADWFDLDSKRPRLALLGPVNAKAFGVVTPVIMKRKPYFVEILAYLALHPEGVTSSSMADAFTIAPSKARTDISTMREWLGANQRTGAPHLPAANESRAFRKTGVKTYQVEDVLVDLDLFRRLRARGQARGVDGIHDLKTAMSLVQGQPFSMLRERGWSWLLDGERLHETVGCSIVDTAHLIVVDALAKGDLRLARETAETACVAAPYDDVCRLDLAKVTAAEGHEEAADVMLTDHVFNRTDDYLPPIELPERTGKIVGKEGWGNAKRRPSA